MQGSEDILRGILRGLSTARSFMWDFFWRSPRVSMHVKGRVVEQPRKLQSEDLRYITMIA